MNQESASDAFLALSTTTVEEHSTKQQRLPKFRRMPDALPFAMQPRDEEFLKACAKFRFLRTHHFPTLIAGGEQGIFRRLQKLYHAGYLARVYDPEEVRTYREQRLGTPKAIYALDNEGAKHLARKYNYPIQKLRWDLKNRRIAPQNIQHTLIITNFWLTLRLALASKPHVRPLPVSDTLQRLFTKNQDEFTDPYSWCYAGVWIKAFVSIPDGDRRRRGSFYPDGFLAVHDSERQEGRNRAFFFLEADNQTLTIQKRMRPKFLAHWAYYEQIQQGNNPLQLSNFRILHVSRGRGRAENLLAFARELYQQRLIGGRLHWFASEDDYSLENPESLLAPIWRIPGDDELHSILE